MQTIHGEKKQKDQVTLLVCANSTGTHKVPTAMVGKYKQPVCIHHRMRPIPYFSQANAWVDRPTCSKWFDEVFVPAVHHGTGQPILLLMDNAPVHFEEGFERNGIRVYFFLPNCTS